MTTEREILKRAFEFHGHKCWASAAGVRAGLAALRALGVERTGSAGELHCRLIAASAFMRKRGQGIPPTQIPEEEAWEMVDIIIDAPEEEVLAMGEVRAHPYQDFGEVMGLHPCAKCGELVSIKYLRVMGDRHVCTPCSGYE